MQDTEHHLEHRTWFPFILIGLTIGLALLIVVWTRPENTESVRFTPFVAVESEMVSEEEYQQLTNDILKAYKEDGNVESAYQSLLDIVIPASYKEVHLELVIIMSKFEAGKTEEAQARLDLLKQRYPWLDM